MGLFGLFGRKSRPAEQNPRLRNLDQGMISYFLEHPEALNGLSVDKLGYMRRGENARGDDISDIYSADDPSKPIHTLVLTTHGYREHREYS